MYVNNSPFSATLFVVILSAVNAFVPTILGLIGVVVVAHSKYPYTQSVGVVPSVVAIFFNSVFTNSDVNEFNIFTV